MNRRLIAAASIVAAAISASTAAALQSRPPLETIRLRTVSHVSARQLEASLTTFRSRLRALGARAYTVQLAGEVVTLRVPHWVDKASNIPFLERRGLLEFFDFEGSLAAGPSRAQLRPRHGSVQISCAGVRVSYCPGVRKTKPRGRYYYLFRSRPALTGASLIHSSVRADLDPNTNEPVVLMHLTPKGEVAFADLTRRLAERGRRRKKKQSLAIVLDREIVTAPTIDYAEYPNGFDASAGVQISGITRIQEAKDIARLLHTHALPAAFEVVH